jgi:PD-(D/E)XK nuclease superfamily protein
MNRDEHGFKASWLTSRIIGVFYEVYNELGPGFLESVHAEAMGGSSSYPFPLSIRVHPCSSAAK